MHGRIDKRCTNVGFLDHLHHHDILLNIQQPSGMALLQQWRSRGCGGIGDCVGSNSGVGSNSTDRADQISISLPLPNGHEKRTP